MDLNLEKKPDKQPDKQQDEQPRFLRTVGAIRYDATVPNFALDDLRMLNQFGT